MSWTPWTSRSLWRRRGSRTPAGARPERGPGRRVRSVGGDLDDGGIPDRHLGDPSPDPVLQRVRGPVAAALAVHQFLHLVLDAELPQARVALVQVLLDPGPMLLVAFVVEELEDLGEDLVARRLVRVPAAHDSSWIPSAAARTRPRSRA